MIIFPFGFYVLEGKLPVYLGHAMHAWLEATLIVSNCAWTS